jgi:hypothetical protein
MSEVSMRHTMGRHIKALGSGAQWQRIEDSLSVGVPDIYCCISGISSWIEAKYVDPDKLPKRPDTPVRIGLKPEQALWLRNHALAGGHAYVLCKIGREWLCWNEWFEALRDGMPLAWLRGHAAAIRLNAFDYKMIPCYKEM